MKSRYRLLFPHGVGNLSTRTDASLTAPYAASFTGPAPEVSETPGVVSIDYPRFKLFQWARTSAEITLNPAYPWTIEVHGGVAHWTADLAPIELAGVEVHGGLSQVDLTLPEPRGTVRFYVSGGASRLTLRRPSGTGARLSVGGGASKLGLDDQFLSAVGGPIRLQTAAASASDGTYQIEIGGGASRLAVSTR